MHLWPCRKQIIGQYYLVDLVFLYISFLLEMCLKRLCQLHASTFWERLIKALISKPKYLFAPHATYIWLWQPTKIYSITAIVLGTHTHKISPTKLLWCQSNVNSQWLVNLAIQLAILSNFFLATKNGSILFLD